jgi:hypothetical protein
MKGQIIATFIVIFLVSTFLVVRQKEELKGNHQETKEINYSYKKMNIFKWINSKDYRRGYLKRIKNEEIR